MKITRLIFPKKLTLEVETAEIADNPPPGEVLMYRFYTQTVIGDKWLCVVVKYRAKAPSS